MAGQPDHRTNDDTRAAIRAAEERIAEYERRIAEAQARTAAYVRSIAEAQARTAAHVRRRLETEREIRRIWSMVWAAARES